MPEICDILAVVEAPADERVVWALVDRVIREHLDPSQTGPDEVRRWVSSIVWHEVPTLAAQAGIRAHGHFAGEPGAPDALAARRALRLASMRTSRSARVVLVRDMDDQPNREVGLKQARDESPLAEHVAIGLAQPEREAWVLAGFQATDARERQALSELRQHLGFDPTTRPGGLRGRGKRSAKQALDRLTGHDLERERACIESTSLAVLRVRGRSCGLSAFLSEVAARVATPIASTTRRSPDPGA